MKTPERYRITEGPMATTEADGNMGLFRMKICNPGRPCVSFNVIASDGAGWEHVSVSVVMKSRCPTWNEMAWIKDQFWDREETVVQFHPKESEYVNNHPGVLHMWKRPGEEYELPPSILVGLKA